MRVFILTIGTRGDFELFRILGDELWMRGHDVVMGAPSFYKAGNDDRFEWLPIGDGNRGNLVATLRRLKSETDFRIRTRLFFKNWLEQQLMLSWPEIASAAAGADCFVSNLKLPIQRGSEVIPGAFITYDPPEDIGQLSVYQNATLKNRIIDIVAMNRAMVDPDQTWERNYLFTGFWSGFDYQLELSPELEAFLEINNPPVVVTMGSMASFDVDQLSCVILEAARISGRRFVVIGSWSGLRPEDVNSDVLCVEEAPYECLFSRAACIVHHGGYGTVTAALRAGKASIVVPQLACQSEFAKMLMREKVATGILSLSTMKGYDLAEKIEHATSSNGIMSACRHWQGVVTEEPGLTNATNAIEKHVRLVS